MRRLNVLALVLVLSGCAGGGTDGSSAEQAAGQEAQAQAEQEAARDKERQERRNQVLRENQIEYEKCVDTWGAFRTALTDLDSRIAVGMTLNDYTTALGDARVEYDRVDISDMGSQQCIKSASRLENAYNAYLRAQQSWQECFEDLYCDFDDSTQGDAAQRGWARASTALANSQKALDYMTPAGS